MRKSIRTRTPLLAVLCAALLLGVMAVNPPPAYAASTYLPPALYSGGDVILSGTAKITSPPTGGQPSAGLYIKGRLTNTAGSGSLSTVKQFLGTAAPALTVFMPDSRVNALIQASRAAPKVVAPVYNGLVLSGTASQSYPAITVNGNLTISGSGTYTFASAYVTGNVVISNAKARFSFGSLYVGGTLTVSGGTPVEWGPTYVAGNTTLSGNGQRNVSLIVTAGNLTISGSQAMGGDGVGTHAKPATILLVGQGKAMTYSSSGTYNGLLCNRYGGQTTMSSGTIKGSVLSNGSCVLSNSASIAYDPNVAAATLDLAAPTTTASLSPTANAAGWINSSSIQVTLNALDNGWAGVLITYYRIDAGAQAIYTNPFSAAFADGTHTISCWSADNVGNIEDPAPATVVKIDATKPGGTVSVNGGAAWTNTLAVTLTPSAADGSGSGPAQMRFSNDNSSWSAWQDYATSASWTLATGADGTRTVYAQFSDKAGNIAAFTDTIGLDTAAPSVTVDQANGQADPANAKPITFTAVFSKSVSALAAGDFTVGGTASGFSVSAVSGSGTTYTVTVSGSSPGDGSVTLSLAAGKVHDAAGNLNSASTSSDNSVTYDATPPTTTAQPSPAANAAGWSNGDVTVTLLADDGTATISWYLNDNVAGAVPYDPASPPVLHTSDVVLHYHAIDRAGNAETVKSFSAKIDSTPPAVTLVSENGTSTGYNQPVFEFGASDTGGSGLSSGPVLAVDGEAINGAQSGQPLPVVLSNVDAQHPHVVTVTAEDAAGHVSRQTVSIVVDAPTLTAQPDNPCEGDVVGLYADDTARTGNPDGSLDGKTWQWNVTVPGFDPQALDGPVAYLVLAAKADYTISLTTTDLATKARCVTSQTISTRAQAPWVSALNVEVLDGQPATLMGRFLDPGWEQHHEAAWSIDGVGDPISPILVGDNFPAMDSGAVAGTTPPLSVSHDGPYHGHLTVTDSTGASTTSDFTVTPVSPNPMADEGLAGSDKIVRPAQSPVIDGNQVHLSYIQSPSDVDVFEVKTPDDHLLPYGTEVLVSLRDLPADYDLAVIQDLGEDVDPNASLESSSFANAAADSWVAAATSRKSPWEDSATSRKSPWEDYATSRKSPWDDVATSRKSPWDDIATSRKSPWDDVATSRKSPWDEYATSRKSPWDDIATSRKSPLEDLATSRKSPFMANAYADAATSRKSPLEDVATSRKSPFVRDPFFTMLFSQLSSSRTSLDGYSFNDMGFTELGANTASGNDMSFAALGFNNEETKGLRIAGTSAHVGSGAEVLLVKTDFVNGHTYIAIKGANGKYSATQPYTLQVETSQPLSVQPILNAGPTPPALVDAGHQTTSVHHDAEPAQGVEPLTLFVTQGERIDALYGDRTWRDTESGWSSESTVLGALQRACIDPLVKGEVISVASNAFDSWDQAPWVTAEANRVTDSIRSAVQSELTAHPSIRYVVLVGSDKVIPQRRVQDQTVIGNEREYVNSSWLTTTSPLAAAMLESTTLTDDYYVDARPIAFDGRSLYVPDIAVSRLVEKPAEIIGQIDQFLASNGWLHGDTSVVTGQDFMADGAQRVSTILLNARLNPTMEPLDWGVDDVRRDLLDPGADVGSINAHFTHYGGLSARGYRQYHDDLDYSAQFLSSKAIAGAQPFTGKLFFSMGCHAGLSVPDEQVDVRSDYAGDPDPRVDIAQAVAQRRGVLVASTGFGFGDTEGISGTEALIGNFAEQATTGDQYSPPIEATAGTAARPETGQPIGLALAEAKRQYLGSLSTVSPYDEKSSIEFTMYGMPQYRLKCRTHPAITGIQASGMNPFSAGFSFAFPSRPFDLKVSDAGSPDQTYAARIVEASKHPMARFLTANVMYTVDGQVREAADAQATFDRPIQPRVVVKLGPGGDNPVKAAVVTSGTYVDIPSFNPAISRVTNEWDVNAGEFQVAADGWWPEKPVTVRTVDTADGREQRLIVLAGQFLATAGTDDGIVGTERVWTSLNVKLIRGSVDDNIPPTVRSVLLSNQGEVWTATVDASDSGKIARIDVTQIGKGEALHYEFPIDPGAAGPYDVQFPLPGLTSKDVALMVAVTDTAGNVTTATAKGLLVSGPPTGTATLNGSAVVTYSPLVKLDSNVAHAVEMRVSTDHSTWTGWRPYRERVLVALPGLPGDKTVWVQYRNDQLNPLELAMPVTFARAPVSAGAYHSLVSERAGRLWTCGRNAAGQVGDGTTTDRHVLSPVDGASWATTAAGWAHTLAVQCDGTLWAWGDDTSGQLGNGSATGNLLAPEQIGSDDHWATVAARGVFSLALKTDGSLWAWGHNNFGQLGDGTIANGAAPERVGLANDWIAIAAGYDHSLALKADGSLWAWGHGDSGQVGDGTATETNRDPVRVGTGDDWVAIAAGDYFSLGLRADGTLWAWGDNSRGHLGDGTAIQRDVPMQIGEAHDWTGIAAGSDHSLAVKTDGSLWAWGDNGAGQLGDGTTTERDTPVRVGAATNWCAVAGGGAHTLALKSDGTLCAWGLNTYGQLGDGTTGDRHEPAQVGSVDIIPPTVTITSPADGSTVATDTPHLVFDIGDGVPASVVVKVDGATVDKASGQNLDHLAAGLHTVTVSAGDTAGNTGSASATFIVAQFTLSVTTVGQGVVVKVPDLPTYASGSSVQLIATADPSWQFSGWSVGASGSANPLTVTMDDNKNITATFVDTSALLHVSTLAGSAGLLGSADGTGSAARFSGPVGVACDAAGNVYVSDTYNDTIRKVTPAGDVTTLAGSAGQAGGSDGTGGAARFDLPHGIACDAAGNVYVGDWNNNTVRKIDPAGQVTTFAGSLGNPGSADGTGSEASFYNAGALTCDAAGNVYVADFTGNTVRKITPGGVVTTLAGSAPSAGSDDGTGSAARFNSPQGIACDVAGNLYVADTFNNTIRMVTPTGDVTTLAGSPGVQGSADGTGSAARFSWPTGIACDAAGTIYVADYGNDTIRRITPSGVVTTVAGSVGVQGSADGTGGMAGLNHPEGVACDAVGSLYIADFMNDTIRKAVCPATAGGFIRVTQSSGGTIALAGQTGGAPAAVPVQHGNAQVFTIIPDANHHIVDVLVDGVSRGALTTLYTFSGVTADHTITASFAADQVALTLTTVGQGSVAKVPDQPAYDVGSSVTVATNADPGWLFSGWSGDASGNTSPLTVTMDSVKSITATFVVDPATLLHVTTLAGSVGVPGGTDGTGDASSFNRPAGLACDSAGNVYVADQSNHTIRKVTPAGVVTTVAGSAGETGSADGAGSAARFSGPQAVTCDAAGTVYVADYSNHTVRKITPAGVVTTFAGSPGLAGAVDATGTAARFTNPGGVACDATGNVYVADFNNQAIRKITPAGVVTTLAGSPGQEGSADGTGSQARLTHPMGVACDPDGNVYFTELTSCTVRKISPTGVVTTVAGSADHSGSIDGVGSAARFNYPFAVTCDAAGNAYVADANNHTIRRVTPAGIVTTVAGTVGNGSGTDGTGGAASFNNPHGIACDSVGNIYISDTGNFTIRNAVCPASVGGFIRVAQSIGGTIALAGQTGAAPAAVPVQHGNAQAFTITPDANCRIVDVLVDGVSQGPLTTFYTFGGVIADHTIAASFAVDQVTLTVNLVGPAAVTKVPDQATYDYGSTVHVTANSSPGWPFSNWSGDASGNANPLAVSMDGDKTITANFVETLHVTTLVGTAGATGSADGTGGAASFNTPIHVATDSLGNVYVADNNNHTIRKITQTGVVTTLAGSAGQPGTSDSTDGTGGTARFSRPWGIACDANDNLYVADSSSNTIRKITPAGVVTTLAGSPGQPGISDSTDGTGATARFNLPTGLACDTAGAIYVADLMNDTIRKITPTGVVTTLAGTAGTAGSTDSAQGSPLFDHPAAVTCDAAGNVYVTDQGNNTVRRITATGIVTTVAGEAGMAGTVDGMGSAALFDGPTGIACDAAGNLYVADYDGHIIRRMTSDGVVVTVAGSAGHIGDDDGIGSAAHFTNPAGIACDAVGNLYIPDAGNNTIRKAVSPSTVGGILRVTQSSGGTIVLAGQTGAAPAAVPVQHGNSQSFTITPDANHHIVDVLADGVSQGPLTTFYTFSNVTADQTITASFAADPIAPALASPNGGESWPVNSIQTITWTPGNGGDVTIELSRDDGASWETLIASTANDGSESWTASGPSTSQALVRISNDNGTAVSNADFAIASPVAPTVTSPNGGESWPAGSSQTITWTPGNGDIASVSISHDGGTTWDSLVSSTPNDGSWSWTAGDGASSKVLVGVSAQDATGFSVGSDVSNADFTVTDLFTYHTDYASGASQYANIYGGAVGDLNGDGNVDLLAANYIDKTVGVLLGHGDGTYQPATNYSTGSQIPLTVAVGDFNDDGKLDAVTADPDPSSATGISVLIGNGDGTLMPSVRYAAGVTPRQVAVADFDENGKQDVVVVDDGWAGVSVLLGQGDGTFPAYSHYTTDSHPKDLAIGDLNADGYLDLAVVNNNPVSNISKLSVMLGKAGGTFNSAVNYPMNNWGCGGVALGDVDADGKLDVAMSNEAGNSLSVFLGNGDGTVQTEMSYTGVTSPGSLVLADLNVDGVQDVAVTSSTGMSILPGNGSGGFGPAMNYPVASGGTSECVRVADLNKDGHPDVVSFNLPHATSVFLNTTSP